MAGPKGGGNSKTIDLVTVLFQEDINLMKLQARSIKRLVDTDCIGRIFLIVNELAPEGVYSALARDVLPFYEDLISKIEILPFTRLMRPHVAVSGFKTGQVLRLLASRIVGSESYVSLDPKCHFVRPMAYGSFVDPRSGKARTYKLRRLPNNGREYHGAADYFGAPTPEFFLPFRAPFTFNTVAVRTMIEAVEAREGAHFDDFFTASTQDMSEFGMYQAWLASQPDAFEGLYRFGGRSSAGIYVRAPNTPEGMEEVLSSLSAEGTQSFSLHRKRLGTLADEEWQRIIAVWVDAGLFGSAKEASAFVEKLKPAEASLAD